MRKAFISHSTPDDRYVTELEQFVRGLGYQEVFNDGHSIAPDAEFWACIEEGIRNCDAFVVVLSYDSVRSYWVDREVQFARDEGKQVIPIRIDDCKLPANFDGRNVLDLRPRAAHSRLFDHLCEHAEHQPDTLERIARALLTSAFYHYVGGDPAAARRDLDEAQQIAERGPMPLYLADVHLHRARLFRDKSELARARTLIEPHTYGRRREEFADAEATDW